MLTEMEQEIYDGLISDSRDERHKQQIKWIVPGPSDCKELLKAKFEMANKLTDEIYSNEHPWVIDQFNQDRNDVEDSKST